MTLESDNRFYAALSSSLRDCISVLRSGTMTLDAHYKLPPTTTGAVRERKLLALMNRARIHYEVLLRKICDLVEKDARSNDRDL